MEGDVSQGGNEKKSSIPDLGNIADAASKAKEIYEGLRSIFGYIANDIGHFWSSIPKFWDKKNIAVIGPTAAGKDSLIARLRGASAPDEYINTSTPEEVSKYSLKYPTPSGEVISLKFKKSLNVGGELSDRERYWGDVSKEADIIFYLFDADNLKKNHKTSIERIKDDMRWIAANKGEKSHFKIAVILNKFDLLMMEGDIDRLDDVRGKIISELVETIDGDVRRCLGIKNIFLTGIFPLCTNNDYLFSQLFPHILNSFVENR